MKVNEHLSILFFLSKKKASKDGKFHLTGYSCAMAFRSAASFFPFQYAQSSSSNTEV